MAVHANSALRANLVMVMSRRTKFRKEMTFPAHLIQADWRKFSGVRVMAVGTAYALAVHFALQEGAVLVVLFQDLPVGIVNTFLQETRHIGV